MGTGTIVSGSPSLLLGEKLVSLAGSIGQERDSSRDRALPSRRRCLDWTRMPAPGRVSSQQATEQPHGASDSPCPLPSVGLLSVTPAALCSTKRKA